MKKTIISIVLILPWTVNYSQTVILNNSHTSIYSSEAIRETPMLVWKFEMPYQNCSNVIIADNKLFANCYDKKTIRGFQYATDKNNGRQLWKSNISEELSTPTIESDIAYYGSKSNKVYALNINDGKVKWKYTGIAGPVCTPPAIMNNYLFFGTHGKEWCVLNLKDGSLINKRILQNGVCCFPSWNEKFVYYTDWDGKLHRQDVLTLGDSVIFQTITSSHVAPTLIGDIGLMTNDNSTLIAVDLQNGKEKWSFNTNGKLWRSPSIANEVCLIITDKSHIYAINYNNGKLLWDVKKEGTVYTSASIAENIAYIGCGDKILYAFDTKTGKELWALEIDEIVGQVFIENKVIYFTAGNKVYAYK